MPTPNDPPRLVIVDDHADAADSLGELLQLLGAEVRVAHRPSDALQALADFPADVVLMDLAMPEMDGWALAGRIREHHGQRTPRLVALTGSDLTVEQSGGVFAQVLVKPVGVPALQGLLDTITRSRSTERADGTVATEPPPAGQRLGETIDVEQKPVAEVVDTQRDQQAP